MKLKRLNIDLLRFTSLYVSFLKNNKKIKNMDSIYRDMRPIQVKRKKQLEEIGFKVYVLDSKEKVEEVIHEIQSI